MLSLNWILEGSTDFEYKKYILLGYLKKVKDKFEQNELYPHLSELVAHYNNLKRITENQEFLIDNLPKEISGIDLKKLSFIYKSISIDNQLMSELFDVVEYAIPQLQHTLNDGKVRYEYIEQHLKMEPVGLLPLYKKEGYFILDNSSKTALIYRYQISDIRTVNENLLAIHTEFVKSEKRSISNHYQQIKLNLIKSYNDLPNPATFVVYSKLPFPVNTALLPITERLLLRQHAA